MASLTTEESLKQYEAEFRFADRDYYERRLVFDHVVAPEEPGRGSGSRPWACGPRRARPSGGSGPRETYDRANPKRIYYLSMEFLLGRRCPTTS